MLLCEVEVDEGRLGEVVGQVVLVENHVTRPGVALDADLSPGRWDANLAEFVLDWDAVLTTPDPHATALRFASSVTRHACAVCKWDQTLANSLEGQPPPIVAIGR